MTSAYSIIMIASASALLTLSLIFLFVKAPRRPQYAPFNNIGLALGISYLTLALSSYVSGFMGYDRLTDILCLVIGSIQAAMVTVAMITFICPDLVSANFLLVQGIFASLLLGAVGPVLFVSDARALLAVMIIAGLIFGIQLVVCVLKFRKAYRLASRRLDESYDDDLQYQLRWAKWGFYCGLAVGIFSYVNIWFNQLVTLAFVATYLVYYTLVIIYYLRYMQNVSFYDPLLRADAPPVPVALPPVTQTQSLKQSLEQWVARKGFVQVKTTSEVAHELGVSIGALRDYMKLTYGEDLRTWRIRLRISEACRMMRENPEMPIADIREACGIPNKGNFHTYFQSVTGLSPAEYRSRLSMNS